MIATALNLLLWSFAAQPALADEAEADACIEGKVAASYTEGWSVRTATSTSLKADEYRIYIVTFYAGNQYRIIACADKSVSDVSIVLHDASGTVMLRDESTSRQAEVVYKPTKTATYYVVVRPQAMSTEAPTGVAGGIGMAVIYK